MKKQIIVLLLKYGLGLGLLAFVIVRYWHIQGPDGKEVGLAGVMQRPIHWPYLVLAAVIDLVAILVTFVRWFYLVRAQDLPFTLSCSMRLGMIGFYLNTFLPGSIGGDLIKAAFIAREQSRRTVAIATIIIDRVIGLCGLIWLAACIGGFFWMSGLLPLIAGSSQAAHVLEVIFLGTTGLMAASILFWLVMGFMSHDRADRLAQWLRRVPKAGGPLAELWRAGWLYRCRGRSVLLALALSLIGHIGFVLVFFFSSLTLSLPAEIPSLPAHLLIVPVGMTISAGVPTPGGVGGSEFIYGGLYEMLNFTIAAGVLATLMQRCVNWALGLAGYLVYLRMKKEGGVRSQEPGVRSEDSNAACVALQDVSGSAS